MSSPDATWSLGRATDRLSTRASQALVPPARYWWRPGMAVASGAAIGLGTAAASTACVNSQPPVPSYCWYYTDPQRTQGFWDVCP